MKRIINAILCVSCILGLCACGAKTWQEHYDLGMRYLSEGKYEQAILSFTAAIEIDPKQPMGLVGRGHAYIGLGDMEENLSNALRDYEAAVALDETNADAYLGIADVYIRTGEYDKALEALENALEKTGNAQSIIDKLEEIMNGQYIDSSQNVRRSNQYDSDGTFAGYTEYEYDSLNRRYAWKIYERENGEGEIKFTRSCRVTFKQNNQIERYDFFKADGALEFYDSFVHDEKGLLTEQYRYTADGTLECYFYFYYDEMGREIKNEAYHSSGEMYHYETSEYDANGKLIRENTYQPQTGELISYTLYE